MGKVWEGGILAVWLCVVFQWLKILTTEVIRDPAVLEDFGGAKVDQVKPGIWKKHEETWLNHPNTHRYHRYQGTQ